MEEGEQDEEQVEDDEVMEKQIPCRLLRILRDAWNTLRRSVTFVDT